MLFQAVAEYLWPKVKFAAQIVATLLWFLFLIFGLNLIAAVF